MSLYPTDVDGDDVVATPYSFFPDLGEAPLEPTVPANVEEVASQLSMAFDDEGTFDERYTAELSNVRSGGTAPALARVLTQELDDQEKASKVVAGAFAATGDPVATRRAAETTVALQASRATNTPEHRPVQAQWALSVRALEAITPSEQLASPTFIPRLEDGAERLSTRNMLLAVAKREGDAATWLEKATFIGASGFIPGGDHYITNRAIGRVIGGTYVGRLEALEAFHEFLMGQPPAVATHLIEKVLVEVGANRAHRADFLRKAAELSSTEAVVGLMADLSVIPAGRVLSGAASLIRRGTPALVASRVAGEKVAADMIAMDQRLRTAISGLSPHEQTSHSLSAGLHPLTAGSTTVEGLAPHIQTSLEAGFLRLQDNLRNKLNAAGIPSAEAAAGNAAIRASYNPLTNKRVHSVSMGEASADGQTMVVDWLDAQGRVFKSEAAAKQAVIDDGLVGGVAVPKNTPIEPVPSGKQAMTEAQWIAEELPHIATIVKGDVLPRIKAIDKELKALEKNYTNQDGDYLFQRKALQDERTAFQELATNSKGLRTQADVNDWLDHLERYTGKRDPAVGLQAKLDAAPSDDLGVVLRGEPKEAIKALFPGVEKNGSPATKAILDLYAEQLSKGNGSLSLQTVLETLAEKSTDAGYRHLAAQLLATKLDWKSTATRIWSRPVDKDSAGTLAIHDSLLSEIRVRNNVLDTHLPHAIEELFLHEAIHAHNAGVIQLVRVGRAAAAGISKATIDAVNELVMLQKRLLIASRKTPVSFLGRAEFALNDPAELITYGLSAPEVKTYLSRIKMSQLGYEHNEQSAWSWMWEQTKQLLGVKNTEDTTALAKVYDVFQTLLKTVDDGERAGFRRAVGPNGDTWLVGKDGLAASRAAPEEWVVRQPRTDPLSYDSVGKYTKEDIDSASFIAIDPKHGASTLAMEARVVGVHLEAKIKQDLINYVTPYYRAIGAGERKRVEQLLIEGDAVSNLGGHGREFTALEAMARGLSQEGAAAYLAHRSLRMAMYGVRNHEMVNVLRSKGLLEIELLATGEKVAGHVSLDGAGYVGKPVYDLTTKTTRLLNSTEMATAYGSGQKVVSLAHPVTIGAEKRRLILITPSTAKARDIVTAVGYRHGEFSRIYTDEYFITSKLATKVDGAMEDLVETIRTAASKREAEEFVAVVNQAVKDIQAGVPRNDAAISRYFDPVVFKAAVDKEEIGELSWHFTRTREEYLNGSVNEALASGRLFTSKRAERLLSTDASRQNTLGVFESLEAEITNVSRVASITQWRETQVRRWMNTFGDMIPDRTGDDIVDFYGAAGAKFTSSDADALFAERSHRYIMRQIGLRTGEERYYQQLTRLFTERYLTGNEVVETVGAKLRTSSVLATVRNLNFNLILGAWNPAQLIIQANGAATAVILHPLYGLAAVKTFPLLRLALMSNREDVWRWYAKLDIGGNSDDFVQLVAAVRKTGILDNLKSTSLYNMEAGATNIFAGYPSRALGTHTGFFNRGEEFSRLVSFDVARREWQRSFPDGKWTSNEALQAIVAKADDYTQNMTKANLARFQEGASSLPLQFAQYNIKLAANIMSSLLGKGEARGFTKTQALGLLLGHVLLYGTAGNVFIGGMVDEMLSPETKEGLSVDSKTYIQQGTIAGLLNQVGEWFTGERASIAFGSRLGALNYWGQVGTHLFTDPLKAYEAMLGPSLGTARRAGSVVDVANLWYKDPDLSAEDIVKGLTKMTTEMASSLRNAAKAYLYYNHQNKFENSKGVALGQLTTFEVLGMALGFQPTAAVDLHNMLASKKAHADAISNIADTVFAVQKQIAEAMRDGNHAYADEQRKLLIALMPTNPGDFKEVQTRVRDRLWPYDTEMQKMLAEYLWKSNTYDKPLIATEPPRNVPTP